MEEKIETKLDEDQIIKTSFSEMPYRVEELAEKLKNKMSRATFYRHLNNVRKDKNFKKATQEILDRYGKIKTERGTYYYYYDIEREESLKRKWEKIMDNLKIYNGSQNLKGIENLLNKELKYYHSDDIERDIKILLLSLSKLIENKEKSDIRMMLMDKAISCLRVNKNNKKYLQGAKEIFYSLMHELVHVSELSLAVKAFIIIYECDKKEALKELENLLINEQLKPYYKNEKGEIIAPIQNVFLDKILDLFLESDEKEDLVSTLKEKLKKKLAELDDKWIDLEFNNKAEEAEWQKALIEYIKYMLQKIQSVKQYKE